MVRARPGGHSVGMESAVQVPTSPGLVVPLAAARVYLVDDSAAIRARLAELLDRLNGVRVVGEAADVPAAVADILATRPDAVVLDLHLQGESGIDVMSALHERLPDVVFIVLTNHPEPHYAQACRAAGAAHFFDKSSEFGKVADVVTRLARLHG